MFAVLSHPGCSTFLLHPRKLHRRQWTLLSAGREANSSSDKWAGRCLLVCAVSRLSRRCVPSLSPPNLFISREKTKQREHPGGCGYCRRNSPLRMEIGRFGGFVPGSWDSVCCSTAEDNLETVWEWKLPVHQHCTQWVPARPALGQRGLCTQTPGCTPGKGCDHHSRSSRQGQGRPRKSACCQTPAWRDTPYLDMNKEENSKTKAHERAWAEWKRMLFGGLYKKDTSGKSETEWYFRKIERAFATGRQRTQLLWTQEQGITRSKCNERTEYVQK